MLLVSGTVAAKAGANRAPRVRKDLGTLTVSSPDIQALAKAYTEMQKLDNNHHHNWIYQANIHGVRPYTNHGPDGVWNQCQHGNWWFFPWHRMYIYYFERIVRKYSGYDDFALPYWYWDKPDGSQLSLHPAFLPGGPLYIRQRLRVANSGRPIDDINFILNRQGGKRGAMAETRFAISPDEPGFGGPLIQKPDHFYETHGLLENDGHDEIHGAVGGWMGNPLLAAGDPIFWVHHANVDRIWIEWLKMKGGRDNPSEKNPLHKPWFEPKFEFYDESDTRVSVTSKEFLDTTKLEQGYVYDMFPDFSVIASNNEEGAEQNPKKVETMATFENHGQELGVDPLRVSFKLDAKAGVGLNQVAQGSGHAQLTLHGAKFSGERDSIIRVYLNIFGAQEPGGADDPRYAGTFTFFRHEHDNMGITTTLPITTTIQSLRKRDEMWRNDELNATLDRRQPSGGKEFESKLTFDELTLDMTPPLA